MRIRVSGDHLNVRHATRRLLRRMTGPLCGLDKGISFGLRGGRDPRVMTAGAELTGVHVLLKEGAAKPGSHHIGGSGVVEEEVLIRVLAETLERYAQLVSQLSGRVHVLVATHAEMVAAGRRVVGADRLRLFSDAQYAQSGFPFQPFRAESPISWARAPSLVDEGTVWVPAQMLLVGFRPVPEVPEPWLLSAVTTGTAAHTVPELAVRNAILELIQIDAAMGHWYSGRTARRIELDDRTRVISRLVARHFDGRSPMPEFYWLPSADLDAMIVACLIREAPGQVPATAIGLGCDLRLVEAMHKALLEAVGVTQMARVVLLQELLAEDGEPAPGGDGAGIFDLDRNVAYYARPANRGIVEAKFPRDDVVPAADLPADSTAPIGDEIRGLVDAFRRTGKGLVGLDLTTEDIRELGFFVFRAWSPDLLSLCLPSAVPTGHPRLDAYGGAGHAHPHPYP